MIGNTDQEMNNSVFSIAESPRRAQPSVSAKLPSGGHPVPQPTGQLIRVRCGAGQDRQLCGHGQATGCILRPRYCLENKC